MTKRYAYLLLTAALGMAAAQTTPVPTPTTQTRIGADARLSSKPVTVNTGLYRGPLSVLLAAIAKSAGYEVVFNFNVDALALIDGGVVAGATTTPTEGAAQATETAPTSAPAYASAKGKPDELSAKPVVYSFVNRPFNEVWPLLMDVYELNYEVLPLGQGQVLRLSQRPAQLAVGLNFITAKYAEQKALEFFGEPSYNEIPIFDNNGKVVDKVRQFDRYVLTSKTMRILADIENNRLIAGGTGEETAKIRSFIATIDIPKMDSPAAPQGREIYATKSSPADVSNVLKSLYPDIKVTPVGSTAQLILNGPKEQLTAALALLDRVDKAAPPAATTMQKVFQLVNASAEEVKATLEGTLARDLTPNLAGSPNAGVSNPLTGEPLDNQSTTATATSGTTSATTATTKSSTSTDKPVTIIADKRTNTVIVRGTAEQVAQVSELIPQLDQRVPQINVQVRIQEITETAKNALGVNWKAGFGGFSLSSTGTSGLSVAFNPTQNLMGFNLGPTLTALQNQGLTKQIYDGTITMQSGQRSLGNSTLTQNASSTAAATIKSGGRLELNIPSSGSNVASIQKQIDYGVNLDFFNPQVAPDGTITVTVRGQVSQLLTTIKETTLPNLLQFQNSEAQTTLTFKSGETLLLSGLLKTVTSDKKDGIPFLSSIPVIGALAGQQAVNKDQTELLVVITGTVVK